MIFFFFYQRKCESLNHLSFAKAKQWRTGELNPCSSGLWAQRDYRDTRPRYTFTIAFKLGVNFSRQVPKIGFEPI